MINKKLDNITNNSFVNIISDITSTIHHAPKGTCFSSILINTIYELATDGLIDAQFDMAVLNAIGRDGVLQNLTESHRWLEMASSQGDSEATYHCGLNYLSGVGVAADPRKGIELVKRGAIGGHIHAILKLTNLMIGGIMYSDDNCCLALDLLAPLAEKHNLVAISAIIVLANKSNKHEIMLN